MECSLDARRYRSVLPFPVFHFRRGRPHPCAAYDLGKIGPRVVEVHVADDGRGVWLLVSNLRQPMMLNGDKL